MMIKDGGGLGERLARQSQIASSTAAFFSAAAEGHTFGLLPP